MKRLHLVSSVLLIPAVLLLSPAASAVPGQITYTGYLEKMGVPYNSGTMPVSFIFQIFANPTGGTVALWDEPHNGVTVTNGVFTVILGKSKPLTPKLFDGLPYYLEVVMGTTTMVPRLPMVATPYAVTAGNCTGNLTPKSVVVGGKTVINSSGSWVGPVSSSSEKDPVFVGSAAGKISPADVYNWNKCTSWGDHSQAGYLKSYTETDPQVGAIAKNSIPRWSGADLVTGSIHDNGINVGIGLGGPVTSIQERLHVVEHNTSNYTSSSIAEGANLLLQNSSSNLNGVAGVILRTRVNKTDVNAKIGSQARSGPSADLFFQVQNKTSIFEAMRIAESGNVGIGTAAPSARLEVTRAMGAPYLHLSSSVPGYNVLVTNTGSVAIGSKNPGSYKLDVDGDTRTNALHLDSGGYISRSGTTGRLDLFANQGDSVGVHIADGAKVGIGTTKPDNTLDVNGGIEQSDRLLQFTYGLGVAANGGTQARDFDLRSSSKGALIEVTAVFYHNANQASSKKWIVNYYLYQNKQQRRDIQSQFALGILSSKVTLNVVPVCNGNKIRIVVTNDNGVLVSGSISYKLLLS